MDRVGVWFFSHDCLLCWFVVFFSSRRRHTRLQGDWSSDVCSSDLQTHGTARGWRCEGCSGCYARMGSGRKWQLEISKVESTEPLVAHLNECVVRVDCDGAFKGTGFFVGPGLVLTCAHSVAGAQQIS